jgi:hypothetical protein
MKHPFIVSRGGGGAGLLLGALTGGPLSSGCSTAGLRGVAGPSPLGHPLSGGRAGGSVGGSRWDQSRRGPVSRDRCWFLPRASGNNRCPVCRNCSREPALTARVPLIGATQPIGCRTRWSMKADATFSRRWERSLVSGKERQHPGDREPPFGAIDSDNGAHCAHRAYSHRRRFDPWDSDWSPVPGLANGETDACSEAGSEEVSMRRFFMESRGGGTLPLGALSGVPSDSGRSTAGLRVSAGPLSLSHSVSGGKAGVVRGSGGTSPAVALYQGTDVGSCLEAARRSTGRVWSPGLWGANGEPTTCST